MRVSFSIIKVINRSTTKNDLYSNAFCLVENSFQGISAAQPITVIFDSKLGIEAGMTDVAVSGTVRVNQNRLSVFIDSISTKKRNV